MKEPKSIACTQKQEIAIININTTDDRSGRTTC